MISGLGNYYFMPAGDPYFNMAVDAVLLKIAGDSERQGVPILRLYSWQSPAITIGYNQIPERALDWSLLEKDLPVIRRVTGGRAIYHESIETTFSFSTPIDLLPKELRSLSATNGLIAKTVSNILTEMGILAEWAHKSDHNFSQNREKTEACFNSVSKYEIIHQGQKIVGGAQRRKGNSFIHQGSIKINGIQENRAIGQTAVPNYPDTREILTIDSFKNAFPVTFTRNWGIEFIELQFAGKIAVESTNRAALLADDPLGRELFF
jgi:lipoate-protein ligase A